MEFVEVLDYAVTLGVGVLIFMYFRGHFNKFF